MSHTQNRLRAGLSLSLTLGVGRSPSHSRLPLIIASMLPCVWVFRLTVPIMLKLAFTHAERALPRRPDHPVEPVHSHATFTSSLRLDVEHEAGSVLLVPHGVAKAQRGQLELCLRSRFARLEGGSSRRIGASCTTLSTAHIAQYDPQSAVTRGEAGAGGRGRLHHAHRFLRRA